MEIYNRPWPLVPNKVRADGGRELDRFRGVEHPADTPNGAEAWVGSLTRANGATRENPNLGYAEVILPDGTRDFLVNVVKRAPETILGKKHMEKYGTSLGMLIKMLDAKAPFLLQCHPTRENARKYWNSRFGKGECWYRARTSPSRHTSFWASRRILPGKSLKRPTGRETPRCWKASATKFRCSPAKAI